MKDFYISLAITCLLVITGGIYAQQVWSLEECIDYALENNIQVKQQQLNIELQEADYLQSKLSMLPDLNGYASHGYNWGQTIDRFTNQFATERVQSNNFYAQTSLTLFNGFQLMNNMKQSRLNLLATQYDADKFMDDISVNIATYYLQVLYNIETLRSAESQLEVTLQQVERTKKLVEAGTLARGDQLTVEAQAAAEELRVVNAQNALQLSYLDLTQALDLPSPEGFEVEQPDIEIERDIKLLPSPENVYGYALDNRPEIKAAETRLQASGKGLDIARGSLSPNLSLSASWGTGYSGANKIGEDPYIETIPIGYTANDVLVFSDINQYAGYKTKAFGDQFEDNNNQTFMIHLNIPIFNGWQARSSIQRAKINMDISEYNLQLEKLNLNKLINQAYNDAESAFKKYRSALKKVNATEEAFKYSEQKFNVGMITSYEYNDTKKELSNAQSELISAKYEFLFMITILDFYMGRPISLENYAMD
ncbi:MAG: TolC family protein [Bacteroidota bacterium]|nr:TolC family protein [Bacteroidota bacterium]